MRRYVGGTNVGNAWGSMYTSGDETISSIAYPFSFLQAPVEIVSLLTAPSNASGWLMCSTKSNSLSASGTYEFVRGTQKWIDGNVCYLVCGHWK